LLGLHELENYISCLDLGTDEQCKEHDLELVDLFASCVGRN
jgi:hypothetical protein